METRRQGANLFSAILVLVITLVVIQLWLVGAALDALQGGDTTVLVAAEVGSLALFIVNVGLLSYVFGFDRRLRRAGRP